MEARGCSAGWEMVRQQMAEFGCALEICSALDRYEMVEGFNAIAILHRLMFTFLFISFFFSFFG